MTCMGEGDGVHENLRCGNTKPASDCETVLGSRRACDDSSMGDTGIMPLTKDVVKFGTFVVTSQVRLVLLCYMPVAQLLSEIVHLENKC
jgi:hypothetical protein